MKNLKPIGNNSIIETGGAKLSRLYQHMNKYDFFIISAFRSENTYEENLQRTNNLISEIRNHLGYGGIQLVGHWIETLDDGSTEKVEEISFFVPNLPKNNLPSNEFLDYAISLGKKYNQEAILFGDTEYVNAIEMSSTYAFVKVGKTKNLTQNDLGDLYSSLKKRNFKFGGKINESEYDNKEYSLKGLLAPIGTFQSLEWEYLGKWL